MQNSYGKLEASNIKCSPILGGKDSEANKRGNSSEVLNNFPYSSLMRNKAGIIRSNFDFNARLPDAMTPYYNRANNFTHVNNFSEGPEQDALVKEQGQQPNPHENPNACQNVNLLQPSSSFMKDSSFLQNKNIMNLNFNVGMSKIPNAPGSGPRWHNSAFLLNYNNNAINNFRNNSQYQNLEADKKDNFQNTNREDRGPEQIINPAQKKSDNFFNAPSTPSNPFPHVYSSILGSGASLKPTSSLFTNNKAPQIENRHSGRPVSLTIINNNNINVSNIQPRIKIKEVIKLADFEKQQGRKKAQTVQKRKHDSFLNKFNSIDSSDSDSDSDEDSDLGIEEDNEQSEEEISHTKHAKKTAKAPKREVNLKPEKKVKSIRTILDSSKKTTEPVQRGMKRGTYKKRIKNTDFSFTRREANEIADIPPSQVDSLETNKFTKKILEDTMNNYSKKDTNAANLNLINPALVSCNLPQVFTQREVEEKLFNKGRRKLLRTKKTDKTKSEISIVEKNDPVAFKDIEYLLNDIPEDDLNSSCNFFNPSLKNEFLLYTSRGKSNEVRLSFGSNPLTIYQDLAEWYLKEKKKLEASKQQGDNITQTTELCRKIRNELNEVSQIISALPVLKKPECDRKNCYLSKKKKRQMITEADKKFKCDVCAREGKDQYFETGQGLGGHMSRVHKGESEKFNKKKEIRSRREDYRKILVEVKKTMLSNSGFNYDFLIKSKEGKMQIKQFIRDHREKYRKMVRELRKNNMKK